MSPYKALEDESAIFKEIIELNRRRILSRLRSRHATWSRRARDKPPVVARLVKAVSVASSLAETGCTRQINLNKLKERTRRLEQTFQQLEAMPADRSESLRARNLLSELSTTAYELSLPDDLEVLGEAIPNSGLFSPGTGSVLRTALGKLGRYYSASRFLCAAARKLTVFKRIRVEGVSQLVQAAIPLQLRQDGVSMTVILDRVFQKPSREIERATRDFQAHSGISLSSAETQLREHLASSNPRRKIHAEIQLIFHYELKSERTRPRVICSSKSSCFLCNLFIKLHGEFYIARTHGVIYHAWALPILPLSKMRRGSELTGIVKRLNLALEDKLGLTLKQRKMRRCHPNESAFIEPAIWTPSVQSLTTYRHPTALGSASTIISRCEEPLASSKIIKPSHHSGSQVKLDVDSTEENVIIRERVQSFPSQSSKSIPLRNAATSASTLTTPRDYAGFMKTVDVTCENDSKVDLKIAAAENLGAMRLGSGSATRTSPMLLPWTNVSNPSLPASLTEAPQTSVHDGQLLPCFPEAVMTRYEPLIQGQSVWKKLAETGSPLRMSTPHIHISLSSDTVRATTSAGNDKKHSRPGGHCWVSIKWLASDEEPKRVDQGQTNIVSLDGARLYPEETSSHGALNSPMELYLARKLDIVAVRFAHQPTPEAIYRAATPLQRRW
ncbi:MAG: hypothetical protein M1816_002369 [Peltula sp. TS41687]|nr:MAG: hypothetical protein M1816_002369 [Peltula sp. TS41687]